MEHQTPSRDIHLRNGIMFAILAPILSLGTWFFFGLIASLIAIVLFGPDSPSEEPTFGIFGYILVYVPYALSFISAAFFVLLPFYFFSKSEEKKRNVLSYLAIVLLIIGGGYAVYRAQRTTFTNYYYRELPYSLIGTWQATLTNDPRFKNETVTLTFKDSRHMTITLSSTGDVYENTYEIRTFKPDSGYTDDFVYLGHEDKKYRRRGFDRPLLIFGFRFRFISSTEIEVWTESQMDTRYTFTKVK